MGKWYQRDGVPDPRIVRSSAVLTEHVGERSKCGSVVVPVTGGDNDCSDTKGVRLPAAVVSRRLNTVPRTVHNPERRAHVITVGRLTVYIQLQSMSRSPLPRRRHPTPQMPWKP